ncbi:hypothetical protein LJC12_04095 [Odoribacter sp. OttesenSCG-928-J03]|nr:hypothetical protein [Odoribacter sp. OttesenSCG-928-J03]MDL2282986.1 hypothetical protein [Odoribacter sp. OttesenSCG-928-G04]
MKKTTDMGKITDRRRESYLSDEVAQLLIEQIGHELNNQYLYHNFAIWYDTNSYFGQAAYFYKRKEEEMNHAQWIIDYLTQSDYSFEIPATDPKLIDIYKGVTGKKLDIVHPHKATIDREIETTELIHKIYEKALEKKDYITTHWLKRLLEEQAEEEELSHVALDIFRHTSDPLIVDKYFKDVVIPSIE